METILHTTKNRRVASLRRLRPVLCVVAACFLNTAVAAEKAVSTDSGQVNAKPVPRAGLDRSGKTRKGKASYYGREFYRKKMADGTPMNPQSNTAASKTLPLGTKAQVTNLKNGNTEVVEIRDRGPYVKNRIVDLSPQTADKLGLKQDGVVPVEVKPLEVPQADGSVKPGAGAGAGAGVADTGHGKSSVGSQETRAAN